MRPLKILLLLCSLCALSAQLTAGCTADGSSTVGDTNADGGDSVTDATTANMSSDAGAPTGDASAHVGDAGTDASDAAARGDGSVLEVPSVVGDVASRAQNLTITPGTSFRLGGGACTSMTSILTDYPMDVVEVDNDTGKNATVTLYQTAGSGRNLDTLIWAYAGNVVPVNDSARRACIDSVLDYCDEKLCGTPSFGALKSVAIPAGGKLLVYSGGYSTSESGPITVNVKTEALQ